jgi:tellurite resistance protein TerC
LARPVHRRSSESAAPYEPNRSAHLSGPGEIRRQQVQARSEITDVIFAVDSVPAIFAITDEPLIVFTSNVFAILGLRALYFLLAGLAGRFHMLKYGLALVRVFVGLKMAWLNDWYGGKFPITTSLAIIAGLILGSVACSLLWPKRHEAESPSAPAAPLKRSARR